MHKRLLSLLPPSARAEPQRAAWELLRAVLVRSNFIPGVRHRLGWRGVASCAHDPEASTARVDGAPGVYGLGPATTPEAATDAALALFYFPAPDEELADAFSVAAGIHIQADDYLDKVRNFPAHPEFAALFAVGRCDLSCDLDAPGVALSLTAPERHVVRALDGVVVDTAEGPVNLVPPGGADQDLPSLATAMALFRVLAASAAYCLDQAPTSLARSRRPMPRFSYDARGGHAAEPWDQGAEIRIDLGFGAPLPIPGQSWPGEPELSWRTPEPHPAEYADAPWWTPRVAGARHSLDKNALGIAEPPRLVVLTGFLGAGKTSFLARFIEQQAARNSFTAVIQNEIGAKGLDARLLGQRYAVTEMDEGCVCCSLAGSLAPALADILGSFQPDFVILETTGLANPANLLDEIAEIGDALAFGSVTTVVDARLAEQTLASHEVARSQVRLADTILLNKADLVDEAGLERAEALLRNLNPVAPIHACEHGDLPATALYGVNMLPRRAAPPAPEGHGADHQDDGIGSVLLDGATPPHREAFLAWMDALPEGVLRAKGVLEFADAPGPQVVQYVPGRLSLGPAGEADAGDRFLVVIGRDLDRALAHAPLKRLKHHHHHHGHHHGHHHEHLHPAR